MKLPPRIFSLHASYWILFLGSLAVLAASRRWGRERPAAREWIFAGTQLAALLLITSIDRTGLLLLVLPFLGAVFLLGKAVSTGAASRRRRVSLAAAVAVPVAVLLIAKYSAVRTPIALLLFPANRAFPVVTIAGLSYMVFKAIHFLVDVSSGRIAAPTLRSFLGFMLFFPTFLSGPMDRYARFRRDFESPAPLSREDLFEAGWRIVVGLFKKTVLAALCAPFAFPAFSIGEIAAASPGAVWTAVYAYAFLIYLDFSGYSDLAIASGRLMGIKVPENFRSPYLKPNLIEFWNAWHITLSHWLRDYLFLPVGKFLMKRRAGGGTLPVAAAAYIVTFAIGGAWHGDGPNFLLWGVYHGVGLALCKAWQEVSRRLPESCRRFVQEKRLGKPLGVAVTFHFVALGWVLFANDIPRASLVFRRLLGVM